MYRGNNPIARTSQQNIADALVRLLKQEPYSSITISGICREADVSRQTFYSLFSSRENIVLYLLDTCHTFEPGKECSNTLSLSILSREYAAYLIDKRELLTLLEQNDLIYLLHGSLYDSFIQCPCFLRGETPARRAFCSEFIAGGLSGIARIYVEQGTGLSQDALTETIRALFSGEMFPEK
ncbi:MAG: TetR/AcrR family transcriptional regulator [Lachnospiraceae bacterium]|jgi:AcrR family transcriptional regulator|nr:TetR/AcrR family transcriptional regulator [Lachnospiraceae bacterium]MCI1398732.1 TetR/AcrR family transcriptional regulator [Lachnospiraceae bacterium]MCI1424754.1 TetR/AcrR family transcriptional regulator [Lachnospiraceae bacterium]MCI1453468.1 TetR/AcrR family transcriptional regulator [Lachnospiraceae bacterium]MDD5847935.1 TetR/AcrR family transcriptional regulator [Bacillota bacterium]